MRVHQHRKLWHYKSMLAFIVCAAICFYLYSLSFHHTEVRNTQSKASVQDMVVLDKHIPDIKVELRYATINNFTGAKIYDNGTAYLRRGTADKLKSAQAEFAAKGCSIKVWDAYRSPSAQFSLWDKFPDARFVINPHKGFSYHSRGVAVDITLIDNKGRELPMPTGFDDFSAKADRDYGDIDEEKARNARLLEQVMLKHGFQSIHYEWWHFVDSDRDRYPVIDLERNPAHD